MKTPYKPKYNFSVDEFTDHLDFFISLGGGDLGPLEHYFSGRYLDRNEGDWKITRLLETMTYVMRHPTELEEFLVTGGGDLCLVSTPVIIAVAHYFYSVPNERLDEEPDPECILKMARELKKLNPPKRLSRGLNPLNDSGSSMEVSPVRDS